LSFHYLFVCPKRLKSRDALRMPLIGLARKPNIENQNLVLVPRGELHRQLRS
jgi:hypothetical protein